MIKSRTTLLAVAAVSLLAATVVTRGLDAATASERDTVLYNAGFEKPKVTEGLDCIEGVSGVAQSLGTCYTVKSGVGGLKATEGSQWLAITGPDSGYDWFLADSAGAATIKAGATYTLSFDIGSRSDSVPFVGKYSVFLRELWNSEVPYASSTAQEAPATGTWKHCTLSFTTVDGANAALVGKPLAWAITGVRELPTKGQVAIDNIRLVETVEPKK